MKFVFTDGVVIDYCAPAELMGAPAVYTALQTEPGWPCADPLLQGVPFNQQQVECPPVAYASNGRDQYCY